MNNKLLSDISKYIPYISDINDIAITIFVSEKGSLLMNYNEGKKKGDFKFQRDYYEYISSFAHGLHLLAYEPNKNPTKDSRNIDYAELHNFSSKVLVITYNEMSRRNHPQMRCFWADIDEHYIRLNDTEIKNGPLYYGVLFCNQGYFIGFINNSYLRENIRKKKIGYTPIPNQTWDKIKHFIPIWDEQPLPNIKDIISKLLSQDISFVKDLLLEESRNEKYALLMQNTKLTLSQQKVIKFENQSFEKEVSCFLLKEVSDRIEVVKNCLSTFLSFYDPKRSMCIYNWQQEKGVLKINNEDYDIILHYYFLILGMIYWITATEKQAIKKLLSEMRKKTNDNILRFSLGWLMGDHGIEGTMANGSRAKLLLPKLFFSDNFDNFYEEEFENIKKQIEKREHTEGFHDVFIAFQNLFTKKDISQKQKLHKELYAIFDEKIVQYIELLGYALGNLM